MILTQPQSIVNTLEDNIPAELKQYRHWVVWKYGKPNQKGKPAKEPFNPNTTGHADNTNPNTWADYGEALLALVWGNYKGLGFVFDKNAPFCGIDLDDCLEAGQLTPFAQEIIKRLPTYTEVSPSGTGLKLFAKCREKFTGKNFKTIPGKEIEIYSQGRYFATTGNHWPGTPLEINDLTDEILALWNEIPRQAKQKKKVEKKPVSTDSRVYYVHSYNRYVWAIVDKELAFLQAAVKGKRNDQLNQCAYILGRIVQTAINNKVMTYLDFEQRLMETAYEIGLAPDEIKKTIKSGLKKGMADPIEIISVSEAPERLPFYNISKPVALYLYLKQFINYDSGVRLGNDGQFFNVPVWANLDQEYNKGLLVVANFQGSLGKKFNVTQQGVSKWIKVLESDGCLKREDERKVTLYDGQTRDIIVHSLGTFIFSEEGEMIKRFYVEL
jgi:hypothetical protein